MVDPETVTGLALCAGVGGLELGVSIAIPGYRTLGFVERDAYAAATLLARMEDEALECAPVFCGDMSDFDARPFAGVDLVTAGLPCQPYSAAGKQEGNDDKRAIWPEFIRIVGECRPAVVFLENVPQFVSRGYFRECGEELCRMGYRIENPLFLRASDVGAPHRRERVFILAHDERFASEWWERVDSGPWAKREGEIDAGGTGSGVADCASIRRSQGLGHDDAGESDAEGCNGKMADTGCRHSRDANEMSARRDSPEESTGSTRRPDSEVAESPRGGQRELRESSGVRRGQPDGSDKELGHSERPRWTATRERRDEHEWKESGSRNKSVADSSLGQFSEQRRGPEGRDGAGPASKGVGQADACGSGREGLRSARQEECTDALVPVFPPGPGDRDEWATIFDIAPWLAPAIEPGVRLLADELAVVVDASRPDQLRCAGNGVVSLQASVALTVLARRAGVIL